MVTGSCVAVTLFLVLYAQVFKKPDPKELVRKWQADLRTEQRKIDRQIRGVCVCVGGGGAVVEGGRCG